MRTSKFRKSIASATTLLMLLITFPLAALAQTANTGTITGVVKDQAGAVVPGATLQPSFAPTKSRVGTFSVGGGTGRNLNITIDGGDNKDNAVGGILQNFTMEGIQEFALSTQRFSAANGRSGGALLSVVSKSGTNSIHG
ncbi:MAG TPA: hypothetical protein VNO14_16535, partial [Blastocatellia bacterium]|nr:hypothetical protein [Blastocatellia bacterium]